jgi:predicted metal-dependent peptidase
VQAEIQAALDDGAMSECVAVYADTEVTRTDAYQSGDQIEFDPKGRGGTDMAPAFQWLEANEPDCSVIVCFTDGMIGEVGPEPSCPVLWAIHGWPSVVKSFLDGLPWQSTGIDVGQD